MRDVCVCLCACNSDAIKGQFSATTPLGTVANQDQADLRMP